MNETLLIELMIELLKQANAATLLLQKAKTEQRDVTDDELDQVVGAADAARQRLVDRINRMP
jgi:hypothetical protein